MNNILFYRLMRAGNSKRGLILCCFLSFGLFAACDGGDNQKSAEYADSADADSDSDSDGDSDGDGDSDSDGDADTDGDTDGDSDSDGDNDGDSDSNSDGDADSDGDTTSESEKDTETDNGSSSGDTDTESDDDSNSDTGFLDADCDNLLPLPREAVKIDHFVASEDFVFDKEGYILQAGVENGAIAKTTYDGESTTLAAISIEWPQGTRLLPEGDLIVTNAFNNELVRIYPNGAFEAFAQGLPSPNGLAVNMDGIIYAASAEGRIYRVDPEENTYEPLLSMDGVSFDGITFSPDYKTLYFNEEMGSIHRAPVKADGTLGEPELFTTFDVTTEMKGLLDGMTTDICGNLYAVVMSGVILRITPDGEVEEVVRLGRSDGRGGDEMIPAVNFGSGVGGWKADHLYIMSFLGGIYEVDMGVVGKPEPHL
ncbi:MAG: SMP-30/gluconolactonase/LRE family protein [Deltaproteobacteria bacterium]|nr:SMP-30/gluconolactonase/LRE family protein [Deltaproteobacteria bacterium]